MEHPVRIADCGNHPKFHAKEDQWILSRFEEFTRLMKMLAVDGSNKYAGAVPYKKEAVDIIPDILGEEGYLHYVLGDLLKRIIRFKNQKRERDLIKIALWTYFLWIRFFPKTRETTAGNPHANQ